MISVVINTLNEESNLLRALVSVKDFADEIVVVDMKSDDATVKIAKKAGAKVFEHEKTGYVEPARNFAISKATGDWILILDADEELPSSLQKQLKKLGADNSADYYRMPRKNIIFGKWIMHARWWPDMNIRFFKKGCVTWNEVIHSVPMTKGNGADLEANEENAVVHHHYETISQYIDRLNRYTNAHAKNLSKGGYKFSWRDVIKKPSSEFLSRYFQGEGYKDGIHGLALSSLQAFSEIVTILKVWELEGFEKRQVAVEKVVGELKNSQSEANYWQADTLLKEVGGLKHAIKRKLKI